MPSVTESVAWAMPSAMQIGDLCDRLSLHGGARDMACDVYKEGVADQKIKGVIRSCGAQVSERTARAGCSCMCMPRCGHSSTLMTDALFACGATGSSRAQTTS